MRTSIKTQHNTASGIDSATALHQGRRTYQEDSVVAHFPTGADWGFCAVSDGMGGHGHGDVASSLIISEIFGSLLHLGMTTRPGGRSIPERLKDATENANERISDFVAQDTEKRGMGATLLATFVKNNALYWCSVGDSPLLLFRGGTLRQLNQDHSMAPQVDLLVQSGALSPEAGRNHPDRHTLTSAVRGKPIARIDCPDIPLELKAGDVVVISSDGLQSLSTDEISKVLELTASDSADATTQALIDAVDDKNAQEQDNTGLIVIKVDAADTGPFATGTPEQPARRGYWNRVQQLFAAE